MTSTSSIQVTDLTLVDAARAVATGEVTPTELTEAYLARFDAVEERVQAFSAFDRDGVLAQAARLTEEARAGRLRGPLHGVPVAVKDEFHVAGMPTFYAEPDVQPRPEDATAVARLRAAGAVIMGKTYMPVGERLPPTRNPWNLGHTAGGSSSGSGAAVGARMVPFALGEQTAGSNLRPAAYCGVEALKPTYGRIGRFGLFPIAWSHDHVGLIGLTMADIALAFSVLGGPDPRDLTSRPEPPPPADLQLGSLRTPRIGVVRNFFPDLTEPVMLEAIERSAEQMKAAGATVRDVLLPDDFGLTWQVHRIIGDAESQVLRARRAVDAPEMPLVARDVVASVVPAAYYLQAQRIRAYLWTKLQALFADLDALLMAVAPGAAPQGIESTGSATLLIPWSGLGYPTATVNGGLSPDGLPLGLQLVAAPMADYDLMRVGAWCERTLGRLPAPSL